MNRILHFRMRVDGARNGYLDRVTATQLKMIKTLRLQKKLCIYCKLITRTGFPKAPESFFIAPDCVKRQSQECHCFCSKTHLTQA